MKPYNLEDNGLVIFKGFTVQDKLILNKFITKWVSNSLGYTKTQNNFGYYHLWFKNSPISHDKALIAKNRHIRPPKQIKNILFNKEKLLYKKLNRILGKFELWDEGLGWLAFRLIRTPKFCDGYPPSKKVWGPGGNIYSLYIPIVQQSKYSSIGLIPNSKFKSYKKIIIKNSKFCKDEYRVNEKKEKLRFSRFDLNFTDCILFSPNTIHTEQPSKKSNKTRLSIEIRFSIKSD